MRGDVFYFQRLPVPFNVSITKTNPIISLFLVDLYFKLNEIFQQNRQYHSLMELLFISFILIPYLFRKQNLPSSNSGEGMRHKCGS